MENANKEQRPEFPHEHDAAIGRIARAWGHLEHMVDVSIWECAGVEQQFGACITSQIGSVFPKLRALQGLLVLRKSAPDLIDTISKFQGNLTDVAELRARAVHDNRVMDSDGTVYRFQSTASNKGVIFGPQKEEIIDLNRLRERIRRSIRRFEDIKQRIRDDLLVSDKRQVLQLRRIHENAPSPDHTTKA